MKRIFIALFTIGLFFSATAQSSGFKYGIKVGGGSSKYTFEDLKYSNLNTGTFLLISSYEQIFSWNAGITASYSLSENPFSFRMSVLYAKVGGQVNILDGLDNSSSTIKETSSRIDIPLNGVWGYKKLRVLAGIAYCIDIERSGDVSSFITEKYADTDNIPFTVSSDKKNYLTYQFGVGLEYDKFSIDLLIDNPMSENLISTSETNYNFAPNPNQVLVSLGFFF